MSERSQRTTIRFGGVRAEVALFKTSGKPKAASYETRRVAAKPQPWSEVTEPEARIPVDGYHERARAMLAGEPIPAGAEVEATADGRVIEHRDGIDLPNLAADTLATAVEMAESRPSPLQRAAGPEADPLADTPVPPPASAPPVVPSPLAGTTVQQGVTGPKGEWIDLTERLAQIDAATKLDGMDVVATIAVNSIHRERVRDAHYVAAGATDPEQYRVLALLWRALRETGRAAVVRWTKRTQQALGIIVARGALGEDAHLLLLEVEWAQNMRPVPPRAFGPIMAEVSGSEAAAAVELVEAFAAGPSALNDLRDERLGKVADLLTLARDGRLGEYVPPVVPADDVVPDDLAAAFAASAAALR